MSIKTSLLGILLAVLVLVLAGIVFKQHENKVPAMQEISRADMPAGNPSELSRITDEEWKAKLSSSEYAVLRQGGTEYPYTSDLLHEKRKGTYVTADCGEPVFRSEAKFDSGTGWPSFWAPISKEAVIEKVDFTAGMTRTEVTSPVCKSHLGHVFNDAPQTPTGLRYCMNGVALRFIPDERQ